MSTDGVPTTEEQQPKKSGYRRLQNRHRALIADHEALRENYQNLFDRIDAIAVDLQRKSEECAQLQSLYAALQSDVQIVLAENTKLIEAIAVQRNNAAQAQPHIRRSHVR